MLDFEVGLTREMFRGIEAIRVTPSITPFPAKLVATAITFVLNYWCRRLVVFDSSASTRNAASALRP